MDIYYPDNGIGELTHYMLEHGERLRVNRGAVLVDEHQSSNALFLIQRGAVKCTCTDHKGNPHIVALMFEGELVGSYLASRLRQPSPFGVVALEDSVVYAIDLNAHAAFFECEHEGRRYVRAFTEHIAHTHLQHYLAQVCLSPWKRLEGLRQRIPDIMQRISQRDMAAYIGVSPEALSRHLSAQHQDSDENLQK